MIGVFKADMVEAIAFNLVRRKFWEWNLEIIKAGSLHGKLPERIYALRFMEYIDIIREAERLKSLLVLFKEMRDQLLIMDSADTAHPNIVFAYWPNLLSAVYFLFKNQSSLFA